MSVLGRVRAALTSIPLASGMRASRRTRTLAIGAVVAGISTLTVVVVATTPQLLGSRMQEAYSGLGHARPIWLWLAGVAFLGSLLGMAAAWRSSLEACGTSVSMTEACARYGIGSLVNTFAPYRLGDAVRVSLFARTLSGPERGWTAGGAFGAIEAARVLCIACLVAVCAGIGALPFWPALAGAGVVGATVIVAVFARRRESHRRLGHLLDAFRGLGRSKKVAARLIGSVAFATTARVLAAAAICAALGLQSPLVASLLVVATLDLAGQIPLTPGNVGVTSSAVALALTARGVGLDEALSAGLALHGVETIVGLSFGLAGAVHLTKRKHPSVQRWLVSAAAALAALAIVAGFSFSVFVDVT